MLIPYYIAVAIVLAVWFGLYLLWKRGVDEDIGVGAKTEYDLLRRKEPSLLEGLDEEAFRAVYARVETPGAPIHIFAAVATFLVGAPFVLALNTSLIRTLERTGVIPVPAEQAQQLKVSGDEISLIARADTEALQYILQSWGGFFAFFSLLAFWIVVLVVVMRRYHTRRPGSLREEILRAR